jgi:hypothetical protein
MGMERVLVRWFGPGRELCSFVCRDGADHVVALLPLYIAATKPARIAQFLVYADLHSPVCAPAGRARRQ